MRDEMDSVEKKKFENLLIPYADASLSKINEFLR